MTTATGNTTRPTPRDEKIYHPLERLRSIIRRYVVIEGLLSVLIFLLAWFVLALVIDFAVFKAFAWDWVQDGAWGLRAAALGVGLLLLAGILVFRIARRLTKEFSHSALALVLERRFPKLLGDRLITAVELADVEGAAKYGYSAAMIRQTINEARERVGQAEVSEVFNWRRLWVMAAIAFGGFGLMVVFGFIAHAVAAGQVQPKRAFWANVHTVSILAERDLLLMDTPWPRRALLEYVEMRPDGIRVARDGPPPRIRVKAYRWVVADRTKPDGWRPMMWSDVESVAGVPVPQLPVSGDDASPGQVKVSLPAERDTWTVDSILEDAAVRGQLSSAMGLEKYEQLQKVFDRLEEMAADASNGRKLRKLDKPETVIAKYVGVGSAGEVDLKPEGRSEYAENVTGLKEDVIFSVRAEDYRTPERGIALIPPPTLMTIVKQEYQPAYLHYASPYVPDPADPTRNVVGGWSALAGLRQRVPDEQVTPTGDRSVFVVPIGSELVVTGVTERLVAKAWAVPKVGRVPGAKPGSAAPVPIQVGTTDEKDGDRIVKRGTFTIEFRGADRVTAAVEFDFVFENEDGVRSTRQMMIQVTEDQAPVVEVIPEVIRKVGKEFWVTPRAKIPFNPESNLRDDAGLSKVAYSLTYEPKDAFVVRSLRVSNLGRAIATHGSSGNLVGLALAAADHVKQVRSDAANARKEASFGLYQFKDLDDKLKRETLELIKTRLNTPLPAERPELVKRIGLQTTLRADRRTRGDGSLENFKWLVEGDYFDVGALKELEVSPGDVQPRYEMQLLVEATDTNFDTGPKVGRHEPITLLIVSASDLLVEMGKDEEKLLAKLDDCLKKLATARIKYEFVRQKSERALLDEIEAVKVRSKDALQDVLKAHETVQAVVREYRRLERECVFNQLDEKNVADFGVFANSLDRAMGDFPQAVSPKEDEYLRNGTLTPRSTFPTVEKLMDAAQTAFDQGRYPDPTSVTNADLELFKLEEWMKKLRQDRGEAQSKEFLKTLIRSIRDKQEQIGQAIVKWQRADDDNKRKPTPQLGTVGQLFLAKGEAKKIRQTINWRQFREDTLVVKVTASDASIVVPAELKLDFEKNDIDFEYEVRAGTKEGDFTITLTPAVGDKVEVKVTVK